MGLVAKPTAEAGDANAAAGAAAAPPPAPPTASSMFTMKTVGPGQRPQWVLGEIVDKEYCQAKKTANRFKVPIGTKFYRVKAIPWTKFASREDLWIWSAGPERLSHRKFYRLYVRM